MGLDRRHLHHAVGALLAAALLLSATIPGATAQEIDDQSEFSYDPAAPNGPDNWGLIKMEWAACILGSQQSPIDLPCDNATVVPDLGFLDYSYSPTNATIVNRGHDIMVNFSGGGAAGRLVINDTAYYLQQLHWHMPSEHTIGGHRYDMELHLVHQNVEGFSAVVAVLYQKSILPVPDPFLKRLEPAIRRIRDTGVREEPAGVVNPNGARATESVYYRYMGSFTTPTCDEAVVWTVFEKPRRVAKYQLELLKEAVNDGYGKNARPLQDVNDRDISIFRPQR